MTSVAEDCCEPAPGIKPAKIILGLVVISDEKPVPECHYMLVDTINDHFSSQNRAVSFAGSLSKHIRSVLLDESVEQLWFGYDKKPESAFFSACSSEIRSITVDRPGSNISPVKWSIGSSGVRVEFPSVVAECRECNDASIPA